MHTSFSIKRDGMKDLKWLSDTKKVLLNFPEPVTQEFGYALNVAQLGGKYYKTKPFTGHGSGLYEIAVEYEKNAYRLIYLIGIGDVIFVIHCFQKKSKSGIKTPLEEIKIINNRIKKLKSDMSFYGGGQ